MCLELGLTEVVCFLLSSETFMDTEQEFDPFCDYDVFVSKSTKLLF